VANIVRLGLGLGLACGASGKFFSKFRETLRHPNFAGPHGEQNLAELERVKEAGDDAETKD